MSQVLEIWYFVLSHSSKNVIFQRDWNFVISPNVKMWYYKGHCDFSSMIGMCILHVKYIHKFWWNFEIIIISSSEGWKKIHINYNIYSVICQFQQWVCITMKIIWVDFFYYEPKFRKNTQSMVIGIQLVTIIKILKIYFFKTQKCSKN